MYRDTYDGTDFENAIDAARDRVLFVQNMLSDKYNTDVRGMLNDSRDQQGNGSPIAAYTVERSRMIISDMLDMLRRLEDVIYSGE